MHLEQSADHPEIRVRLLDPPAAKRPDAIQTKLPAACEYWLPVPSSRVMLALSGYAY